MNILIIQDIKCQTLTIPGKSSDTSQPFFKKKKKRKEEEKKRVKILNLKKFIGQQQSKDPIHPL